MTNVIRNELGKPSSNHEQGFCILCSANTLMKGMNPMNLTIIPPNIAK